MIGSPNQLQQAIEQIERLYVGLNALRRDVLPQNAKNFAILAEGPLDEIRKLQSEIDEYVAGLGQSQAA
jgi:hypothetical protein